jgi:hypothetical protein
MISQAVEDRLIERIDSITDVTVHIDPEDDEDAPSCRGLPLRGAAEMALEEAWKEVAGLPAQRDIRLHYLNGQVEAELTLPLASFVDSAHTAELQSALAEKAARFDWFGELRLLYQ